MKKRRSEYGTQNFFVKNLSFPCYEDFDLSSYQMMKDIISKISNGRIECSILLEASDLKSNVVMGLNCRVLDDN